MTTTPLIQEAVQCGWPAGCNARTRSPVGLCHHHQRFSGSVWANDGEMLRRGRLDSTIKLSISNDEASAEVIEQAKQSIKYKPQMIRHPRSDEAIIITNVGSDEFPLYGQSVELPYEDQHFQIFRNDGTNDVIAVVRNQEDPFPSIGELKRSCDTVSSTKHAREYDLYDGVAEEYDDAAEAIAQLDLGRPANGKFSLMSPNHESGIEVFRLKPNDEINDPELVGVLQPSFPTLDENNHIRTSYTLNDVTSTHGEQEFTEGQRQALNSLIEVRNMIEHRGIWNKETGTLFLPRGWTDQ